MNHWKKRHKQTCRRVGGDSRVNSSTVTVANERGIAVDAIDETAANAKNEQCVICLQEPIQNPVVLSACQHAFCSGCLIAWQRRSYVNRELLTGKMRPEEKGRCPMCRKDAGENVEEALLQKARILEARASTCKDKEQQAALRKEAVACLDKAATADQPNCRHLHAKCEFLVSLQEPEAALKAIDEFFRVNEERMKHPAFKLFWDSRQAELDGNKALQMELQEKGLEAGVKDRVVPSTAPIFTYFLVYMLQAEAYMQLENWESALKLWDKVMFSKDYRAATPYHWRKIYQGFGRCCYETRRYAAAIHALEGAVEIDRHLWESYKWKVLSHVAKGERDLALRDLNQALLYGRIWQKDELEEAWKMYNTLQQPECSGWCTIL
jgi:tetratricopeptide (TPR) repeat protein